MTIESLQVNLGGVGPAPSEEAGQDGAGKASRASWPSWHETAACDLGPGPAVDIEALAREYLGHLKEEARTARAVSRIKQTLLKMQGDRVLAAMRKQSDRVRASGIFQGVISMAAAVATAVSAGVGAAGAAGVGAGMAKAGSAATTSSGALAGALAGPTVRSAAKTAVLKAGPQLVQTAAHLDPFRVQADRLDAQKQKHQNLKDRQSLSLQQTENLVQSLARMKSRVMQIMERAAQLEQESKNTAASAVRG